MKQQCLLLLIHWPHAFQHKQAKPSAFVGELMEKREADSTIIAGPGFGTSDILLILVNIGRLDQYQHPSEPKFKVFNKLYLAGVRDGLIAYSRRQDAKDRLFCIPPNVALTTEQAEDIMLRMAEKVQLPGNTRSPCPYLAVSQRLSRAMGGRTERLSFRQPKPSESSN